MLQDKSRKMGNGKIGGEARPTGWTGINRYG
jgi:hypothetical protein